MHCTECTCIAVQETESILIQHVNASCNWVTQSGMIINRKELTTFGMAAGESTLFPSDDETSTQQCLSQLQTDQYCDYETKNPQFSLSTAAMTACAQTAEANDSAPLPQDHGQWVYHVPHLTENHEVAHAGMMMTLACCETVPVTSSELVTGHTNR